LKDLRSTPCGGSDGLGGGSSVTRNVLANFCRESSDHGPFNSWDRQVYIYDDAASGGAHTVYKHNDTISHNFMLANYHSSMVLEHGVLRGVAPLHTSIHASPFTPLPPQAIDNDDGSAFYDTHHNVFISASSGAAYGGNSMSAPHEPPTAARLTAAAAAARL
jgi:hypothetical protein